MKMTDDRYARLRQMEWWDGRAVAAARALVAGAGALGNEVVKNLLLLGWGTILVVDFDSVELSNLSRAVLLRKEDVGRPKAEALADRARTLNPDCRVIDIRGSLELMVSAGMAARMDVVFGCLDNVGARLTLSRYAGMADRLLIDGGLTTWEGTVGLFLPSQGACYACTLTEADLREEGLRRSCPAYAARARAAEGVPTTPTVASITAALMVQEGLKWIHGRKAPPHLPLGGQIRVDTAYDRFWKVGLPRNPQCLAHPVPALLAEGCPLRADDSWATILAYWRERVKRSDVVLDLPATVLESWECPACRAREERGVVWRSQDPVACGACGGAAVRLLRNQITGVEGWLQRSPAAMGLPPWPWISARTSDEREWVFELAGGHLDLQKPPKGEH